MQELRTHISDNKQDNENTPGEEADFWNLKAYPWWDNFSNKDFPLSRFHQVQPIADQIFRFVSQWEPSQSGRPIPYLDPLGSHLQQLILHHFIFNYRRWFGGTENRLGLPFKKLRWKLKCLRPFPTGNPPLIPKWNWPLLNYLCISLDPIKALVS